MASVRVLVVDDSASVRTLVSGRLRKAGYEVEEAASGEAGAERALRDPPDVVVTDLVMSGISGVQLCRVLRSDPSTGHVPVVLLTGSGDKRSRFWARSAGASAYVSKDRLEDLLAVLPTLVAKESTRGLATGVEPPARRRAVHERVSDILDTALFESVVSGAVRALAASGNMSTLFEGLVELLSDVLTYRWLALNVDASGAPLLVHAHPEERDAVQAMARATLCLASDRETTVIADARAAAGEGPVAETFAVVFGNRPVGQLAVAPTRRGMSRDERMLLSLAASELASPLEITKLYEDARRLAAVDALTGLLNRRAFLDVLDRERARAQRHEQVTSLLLLDVDHFKRINDDHGHRAGDAVLAGVARVLGRAARRSDVVARWGGEEFVVALPQTGAAGARVAAERIRQAIAEAEYPCPGCGPLRITASVGLATGRPLWVSEELISEADEAMYAAKARGRNRVECTPRALAEAPRPL